MVLTYFLNDFEMVPVAPIIIGIALVFTFHICCISIVSLYVSKPSQLLFKSHSCLLKLQHLSTHMFRFHNCVLQCLACYWGWSCQFVFVGSTEQLPYLLNLFLLILVHVHTSVLCLIVPPVPCICWSVAVHPLTLSCLFIYRSFASIGHADMMWSIVSSNWWQSLHLLSVSVFSIFVVLLLLLVVVVVIVAVV
jgi:hypothetical protein